MYVEPSWVELLISGIGINVIFIIIAFFLALLISKLNHSNNKFGIKVITVIIFVLLLIPASIGAEYSWHLLYEEPSVREEVVTINSIQPLPGAVKMNQSGYYIENADQLMFITTNGKEFKNTENWMFSKFETRTIFNQLKVNGTYKIKYYGWRNGHSNEFPNILSVQVINENGTQPNDYNKYFGANRGNRAYDLDMEANV